MTYSDREIFNQGWIAYHQGKSNIDNPYTDDGLAELWNDGYLEAFDTEQEEKEYRW